MKVKVIREYDITRFEDKLNELIKNNIVKDIQTHTEQMPLQGRMIIYYIAIVVYKDIVNSHSIDSLNFSARIYNALKRNNIDTVEDLKEVSANGDLRRIRNLGLVSIREIENRLKELS